jgi:hypothetical protein
VIVVVKLQYLEHVTYKVGMGPIIVALEIALVSPDGQVLFVIAIKTVQTVALEEEHVNVMDLVNAPLISWEAQIAHVSLYNFRVGLEIQE